MSCGKVEDDVDEEHKKGDLLKVEVVLFEKSNILVVAFKADLERSVEDAHRQHQQDRDVLECVKQWVWVDDEPLWFDQVENQIDELAEIFPYVILQATAPDQEKVFFEAILPLLVNNLVVLQIFEVHWFVADDVNLFLTHFQHLSGLNLLKHSINENFNEHNDEQWRLFPPVMNAFLHILLLRPPWVF